MYEITTFLRLNSNSTLHHLSYLPVVSGYFTWKHLKPLKNSGWTVQSIQLQTIWVWTSPEYKQTKHQQIVLDTQAEQATLHNKLLKLTPLQQAWSTFFNPLEKLGCIFKHTLQASLVGVFGPQSNTATHLSLGGCKLCTRHVTNSYHSVTDMYTGCRDK